MIRRVIDAPSLVMRDPTHPKKQLGQERAMMMLKRRRQGDVGSNPGPMTHGWAWRHEIASGMRGADEGLCSS